LKAATVENYPAQGTDSPPNDDGLGIVHFPVSCSTTAQAQFSRGISLLHSFLYEEALETFKSVENIDPQCAMAYWGEGMSLYPLLSDAPDEDSLKAGQLALAKATSIGTQTPREAAYISALTQFYADFDKITHSVRADKYLHAMESLSSAFPNDDEAASFYALTLLGSALQTDPGLAKRKRSAEILERIFAAEPNHPGAAHYLIHVYDNADLANQGLSAARRYSQIAPVSSHAQHMPSHIFNRLGLWHDSIASNLAAIAAAQKAMERDPSNAVEQLHPMDYLDYAYLQIGRQDKAHDLLLRAKALQNVPARGLNYLAATISARQALELRDWKLASVVELPRDSGASTKEIVFWARVIGASRTGDVARARQAFYALDELRNNLRAQNPTYSEETDIYRSEAMAWVANAEGDESQALRILRASAELEEHTSADRIRIPAREMLADLLLTKNRATEALAEYELSLRFSPNRLNSLYGAAVSASRSGEGQKARQYSAQLLRVCEDVGHSSSRPEFASARQLLDVH
jgi:hypothetical protein